MIVRHAKSIGKNVMILFMICKRCPNLEMEAREESKIFRAREEIKPGIPKPGAYRTWGRWFQWCLLKAMKSSSGFFPGPLIAKDRARRRRKA